MTPQQKPKIAILSIRNTYNYGGVLSNLKVAYEFCEQYFTPTVFFLGFDPNVATNIRSCKFTSTEKPLTYFGMNCIEIGSRWSFWEPGHYEFTINRWRTLLNDFDYFFVISGTCIAAHPLVLLNKKFALWMGTLYYEDRSERIKKLTGIHKILHLISNKQMLSIEQQILKKTNVIFAISTYTYQKLRTKLPTNKNFIMHCGFPLDCSKNNIPTIQKEPIILVVGRLSDPRKNVDMLMRVFEFLYKKIPSIRLYAVGTKPTQEKILTWGTYESFKNVNLVGQISAHDLAVLYQRASLLLITSYQEGLGIVGLEALMHGTPVIATDCGGTSDYVIDNKTGFLIPINDDKAMVEKALSLLNNPQRLQQFSVQCTTLIKEQFDKPVIYDKLKHGLSFVYPELKTWFEQCDKDLQHLARPNNQIRSIKESS